MNVILVTILCLIQPAILAAVPLGDDSAGRPLSLELSEKTSGAVYQVAIPAHGEVQIPCLYQDYHQPDILWSSPENRFLNTENQKDEYTSVSTLTLSGAKLSKDGERFTCQTVGLKVNFNVTVSVSVEVAPRQQTFKIEITSKTTGRIFPFYVEANTLTELICLVQDYVPPPLEWHGEGPRLPSEDTVGDFSYVSKLSVPSTMMVTEVNYTCQTQQSDAPMFVVVQLIVTEGNNHFSLEEMPYTDKHNYTSAKNKSSIESVQRTNEVPSSSRAHENILINKPWKLVFFSALFCLEVIFLSAILVLFLFFVIGKLQKKCLQRKVAYHHPTQGQNPSRKYTHDRLRQTRSCPHAERRTSEVNVKVSPTNCLLPIVFSEKFVRDSVPLVHSNV